MANQPDISELGWAAEQTPKADAAYSRDLISAYNAIRTFEGDFDKAQGQLRAIASAWLLAGIGAIGLLVIQEVNHSVPANGPPAGLSSDTASLLRQILLLVIAMGISSLWKLDQKVYQNLLHNVFALGYWIEFKYKQVPPTRMMLYHSNYDITDSLGEFYSRPVLLIWICAAFNWLRQAYDWGSFVPLRWSMPQSFVGLLPSRDFAWWGACFIIFVFHSAYWLSFRVRAKGWGRLGGLLPEEAEAARQCKGAAPSRMSHAETSEAARAGPNAETNHAAPSRPDVAAEQ